MQQIVYFLHNIWPERSLRYEPLPSKLFSHNSLSNMQDMQENGLPILPDQLDVYLPSIAAEHSTQGVFNLFLKIIVYASATHNNIYADSKHLSRKEP